MDTLALTDRDGTYGAVRFAKACLSAGVRPVLGVDLAYAPTGVLPGPGRTVPARTPVRGGAFRDPRLPRATFLASGRRGWAALCRLVSATHLAGERGRPVTSLDLVAEHLAGQDVLVLLGPGSEVGRAATLRRDDLAGAALQPWLAVLDRADLLVEVVSHRLAGSGPGSSPHAARMLGVARSHHLGAVLTNAVRYADRADAPTVDVLDAARRLVPLDLRHVDRGNAEGFLKSGKQMHEVAEEITRFAGAGGDTDRAARELLSRTRVVADRCALDPRADLGLGEVHFPEFELSGGLETSLRSSSTTGAADALLRARCEAGIGDRYGSAPRQRIWKRLDDELAVIGQLGYASYFLTVGDVTDLIREMGVRCAARGSGAGSLVNYLLKVSGVDPLRHGLLMERFLSPLRQALPDIDVDVESARRLEVYEAILDKYGGERCVCVSMMDTYRVRHAVRDVGAALGMPAGEVDAIAKAFPHIRARDARLALRELPELRASGLGEHRLDLMFRLVERLDGLPRHIAVHPCGVLLSDATLLDRTPVEASYAGFPMSQFDKDDVEDLGLLKLDVLGIRMQSSMAHALTEIKRVDGVELDLDDEGSVPFDDPRTFSTDLPGQDAGLLPDRVARPARAGRQVGAGDVRGHHHRHLAVPTRPGEERHDHAVPQRQAGLADAAVPPRGPPSDPGADPGRGGLPRAGDRDDRPVHRLHPRRGRRGPPGARRRRGDGRDQAVVLPAGNGPRLLPPPGRGGVEGPRGVRLVRLLQGPRGRVRAADLPVGLAQGALPGALPGRGPHPRPRDVPQAADPRRRPPVRHRRARARRQRQREDLRGGEARRVRRAPAGGDGPGPSTATGTGPPRRSRLWDPAGAVGGEGDLRGGGRPGRRGPALPVAHRLLAPRPGLPADRRAARAGRRLRLGLRDRLGAAGRAAPRQGHPSRPAAPGRRPRPAHPRGRPGQRRPRPGAEVRTRPGEQSVPTTGPAPPRPATAATPGSATRPVRRTATGRATGCGRRPPGSRRRPGRRPRSPRCSSPSTSATPRSTGRSAGCRR